MKDVSEPYPTAVMADAAKAITKSLNEVLPETTRLTCFFHVIVMKNVKDKLCKLKNLKTEKFGKNQKRSSLARTTSTSRGAFFAKWLTFEPRSPTKNLALLKIAILKRD